jgi:hypothetical protein
MMKLMIVSIGFAAASMLAYADGVPQQYDQAIETQMSLNPNEALENDDGRPEDPNARMTERARAFRNGIINGRRMQKEEDEQHADNPPPLPPDPPQASRYPRALAQDDQSHYTTIPPQPGAYAQYAPSVDHQQYAVQPYGAYAPAAELNQAPPAAARAVTNVYVQAPQPQPYYTPPVPPAPAYQEAPVYYQPPPGPPQSTYVIIPGVPPTLATGYLPRGFQPPLPAPRYYYRAY